MKPVEQQDGIDLGTLENTDLSAEELKAITDRAARVHARVGLNHSKVIETLEGSAD